MYKNFYLPDGSQVKGIELPQPSSFRALPKFSGFNQGQLRASLELESSFVRQSGLQPGTYSKFSDLEPLLQVQDRLWDYLEIELHKLDRLDTCKRLYEKLEIIYGTMNKLKYQTASEQALTGNAEGSSKRVDAWIAVTPFTEGIKFLIEMCVKHCSFDGKTISGKYLDFLIGLSARIFMLDEHLDLIHDQIVPFEITISPELKIMADMTSGGKLAINDWLGSVKTHASESNKEWLDTIYQSMGPKIQTEKFAEFPEILNLNSAMLDELNYGFFDWLNYEKGCMDYFNENEFLKAKSIEKLKKHLNNIVGLSAKKVEEILKDHALSFSTIEYSTRESMYPMQNYNRDTRLLRRPLLDITQGNIRLGIWGIETFQTSIRLFYDSLERGTLRLPRIQPNGAIKSAIGTLQAQIGAPFRDDIATKCTSMGLIAEKEWQLPKKQKTEKIVGPIDVLIIDKNKKRIILAEAKTLGRSDLVPKEMKNEREKFLDIKNRHDGGFIKTLNEKETAFISNKEWHFRKLNIDESEGYKISSVIVVNHPTFWPLVESKQLPILDDLEFYKRLRYGEGLLSKQNTIVTP